MCHGAVGDLAHMIVEELKMRSYMLMIMMMEMVEHCWSIHFMNTTQLYCLSHGNAKDKSYFICMHSFATLRILLMKNKSKYRKRKNKEKRWKKKNKEGKAKQSDGTQLAVGVWQEAEKYYFISQDSMIIHDNYASTRVVIV